MTDALEDFVSLVEKDEELTVEYGEYVGSSVFVERDGKRGFEELPATGISPESISVVKVDVEGYLDVNPIDAGGERREVTPEGAINYIKEVFL
jgi:hypothetical protein